jgi:hypothetical protein
LWAASFETLAVEHEADEVDAVGPRTGVELVEHALEVRRGEEQRREHAVAAGGGDGGGQLGVAYDAGHRRALDRKPAVDQAGEGGLDRHAPIVAARPRARIVEVTEVFRRNRS